MGDFVDTDLHGARFVRADLSSVVMRAVALIDADIDAPWLFEGGSESSLLINGVDVIPLVDAELDRRFPGRAERHATDPEGLRQAWAKLDRAWAAALARVEAMPAGTVEASVDGEWSFAETVRHLVTATDAWFNGAIMGHDQPFHPLGQPHAEYETDGFDMSVFATRTPTYAEVVEARAERVGSVRDFLTSLTPDDLAAPARHPWVPDYPETTLTCLQVILREEWDHLRYALRDLDALVEAQRHPGPRTAG